VPCAGVDVDVRHPSSGLADEFEIGQQIEQRFGDRGALSDQHQRIQG
jgi:hypothetical protein